MRARITWTAIMLAAVCAAAGPAYAAQEQVEPSWLPWYGCWEPAFEHTPDGEPGMTHTVCFVPGDEPGTVELLTVEGARVVTRDAIYVDGTRRDFDSRGCAGWESASWSADGTRVYTSSELRCEGGTVRRGIGILALASPDEWLDIQVVTAGTATEVVRVVRYRAAADDVLAETVRATEVRALAIATARQTAAAPVTVAAVQDALAHVDAAAVEAWLIERESRFALDARTLIALDDAGVPARVIDLLVALSHPDVFAIDHGARTGELLPAARERDTRPADARYGYGRYYSPFGWYWDPFYRGYYGSRYPYGFGYGRYYPGSTPVIVIVRPGDDDGEGTSRARPRAVRERGYTRGGSEPGTTTASPRGDSRSGSSGSAAPSATSSSGRSDAGSSSSGRSARRRDGGNNE